MTTGSFGSRAYDPRRPRRMGQDDVKKAMLETAMAQVNESGLTVSLQHISFDMICAAAGVARSAAYRVWPKREDFFDALLLALANKPESSPSVFDADTLIAAMSVLKNELQRDPDLLATASSRYALVVEMCRLGTTVNYENITRRRAWTTYLALSATALSYPEPMGTKLQTAIAENEAIYIEGMAEFYEMVGKIVGRRVRNEFSAAPAKKALTHVAAIGSAVVEGLVLRSATMEGNMGVPDPAAPLGSADPFDTGLSQPWTAPALAFTSVFMSMTEAIPEADYDATDLERRIEAVEEFIANLPEPPE